MEVDFFKKPTFRELLEYPEFQDIKNAGKEILSGQGVRGFDNILEKSWISFYELFGIDEEDSNDIYSSLTYKEVDFYNMIHFFFFLESQNKYLFGASFEEAFHDNSLIKHMIHEKGYIRKEAHGAIESLFRSLVYQDAKEYTLQDKVGNIITGMKLGIVLIIAGRLKTLYKGISGDISMIEIQKQVKEILHKKSEP